MNLWDSKEHPPTVPALTSLKERLWRVSHSQQKFMKRINFSNLEGFYLMDSSNPAGDDSSSHFCRLHSDTDGGNNYTCILPEPQTPYTHVFLPLLPLLPDFYSKHLPPEAPESQGLREENLPCFCVSRLHMTLELSSTECESCWHCDHIEAISQYGVIAHPKVPWQPTTMDQASGCGFYLDPPIASL